MKFLCRDKGVHGALVLAAGHSIAVDRDGILETDIEDAIAQLKKCHLVFSPVDAGPEPASASAPAAAVQEAPSVEAPLMPVVEVSAIGQSEPAPVEEPKKSWKRSRK